MIYAVRYSNNDYNVYVFILDKRSNYNINVVQYSYVIYENTMALSLAD